MSHASPQKVTFSVYVQPRASNNAIVGMHGDALKVRLTAPPVDGAANAGLIAFLAKEIGVAKSAIRIVAGESSRRKVVEVITEDGDIVRRLLDRSRRA